ncbi:MAG: VOC family protein [Betaproteobacteria bacterium]
MSDMNTLHNRAVWFDIPVADLDRAAAFYRAVLAIDVQKQEFDGFAFCFLAHDQGNGGCLVPGAAEISSTGGILVYLNVDRRIRAAMVEVEKRGGKVQKPVHPIGPHGFRAIVQDSEGNRIALHSTVDT